MREILLHWREAARRRFAGAAAIVIATLSLGLLLAALWPPQYRAQALLLVQAEQGDPAQTVSFGEAQSYLSALTQRMLTRTQLLDISSRLGLHDGLLMDADAIVNDMRQRISSQTEGGGGFATTLQIEFAANNPRVAAHVANVLAEYLLAESTLATSPAAMQTADILQREAHRLQSERDRAAAEIDAFRVANAPTLPEALPALRAQADALRTALAQGNQTVGNPGTRREELVQQLDALQTQIDQSERNAVTLDRMERDLQQLQQRQQSALGRIAAFRATDDAITLAPAGLTLLLIDPAESPTRPSSPNRNLLAMLGAAIGLVLAGGYVLASEMLDPTIRRARDIEARLGQMPLVSIPFHPARQAIRRAQNRRRLRGVTLFVALAGAIAALHLFVTPVDVIAAHLRAVLGLDSLVLRLREAIFG